MSNGLLSKSLKILMKKRYIGLIISVRFWKYHKLGANSQELSALNKQNDH